MLEGMALHSTASVVNYVGNGSSRSFPLSFAYDRAASIKATLISPGGTQQPQTPGAHFTVSPDGGASGTVTFTTAPPSGWTVRLMRVLPLTQPTTLPAQGPFSPAELERMADRGMMVAQQINDGIAVNSLHGDQPGGSLHTLATRTTPGFYGDKALNDDHRNTPGNPHGTSWEDVGAAPAGHTHTEYAPAGHTHTEYAGTGHNHDGRYATKEQGDQLRTEMDTALPVAVYVQDTVAPKVVGWNNHVAAVGNPHGTTAANVGAAAVNHTHAQADVGGLGSDLTAIRGRLDALEGKTIVQGIVDVKPGGATLIAGVGIDSVTRVSAGKINVKIKPGNTMKSKDYVVVVTPFAGTGRNIAADVAIADESSFTVTTYNRDNTAEDVGFRFIATDPK